MDQKVCGFANWLTFNVDMWLNVTEQWESFLGDSLEEIAESLKGQVVTSCGFENLNPGLHESMLNYAINQIDFMELAERVIDHIQEETA